MAVGELDSVDRALLSELQKDARQTNKSLAAKVGIAPSTCLERVRELRARGVIRGFRADVDPAAVGRPMEAILSIQQRPAHGRGAIETLLADVSRAPETLRVMAQENRDMRMSEAEKKAAALPPKLTVPMILFFLPVLFIVILGPAAIRVMEIK